MKEGRNRTANILPEKLLRKDPLAENVLFKEHAGDKEYDKKESLEENGDADPEKVDEGGIAGIDGVQDDAGQKDDELDRSQEYLDFSPYGCVAFCKLFRSVTWHDSVVLHLK